MEFLFILLAIGAAAAIPVALIILIVLVVRYGRRITALEARLNLLKPGETSPIITSVSKKQPLEREPEQTTATGPEITPEAPPRRYVLRTDKIHALWAWLGVNWIYLVAAVSLALAGIFLLQYGIDKGLLPPVLRVAMALAFGMVLILAGEYIRRRWGDSDDAATAFLPSVFSGAGIVVLFAAVLAALHLYALIGPFAALFGLGAVAVLAIILGWYSGPLLAAVGVLGAMAAPFVVGGESDNVALLYLYFAIITLVGMVIDAIRRWAWVTVLTLVSGYGAALMLFAMSDGGEWLLAYVSVMAIAAIIVPPMRLTPRHDGVAMADIFASGRHRGWPSFPVRIAWGANGASVAIMVQLSYSSDGLFWLCVGLMAGLFVLFSVWARQALALEDMTAGPIVGVLAALGLQGWARGDVVQGFHAYASAEPGTSMPMLVFVLAGLGALMSMVAAWRSLSGGARWPIAWAACAALTGPLVLVVLEVWWQPARVIPTFSWALTITAMAAFMTVLTGVFVRPDGPDKRRVALLVLAAFSMVSFAFIIVLSDAALTLALALTMVAAALMDRRFNMAAMMWFVQVMVIIIGWRLIIEPGINWAGHAGLGHVVSAFGGVIIAMITTYIVVHPRGRTSALILLESAIWSLTAIFLSVLIWRILEQTDLKDSHLSVGLVALVWLISAANQLWRLQAGGRWMRWVRLGLASLFGVLGLFLLGVVLLVLNPVVDASNLVLGPVLLNSLVIAYLAPALVFGLLAWRFTFLPRRFRIVAMIMASILATLWLALAIRHFWQGPVLSGKTMPQGELYSYTIAMLTIGAGTLYQAIARGSKMLRRVAMTVIALTVAKVYLVDMSGLTGLTRVFSFLALGLSLAGLAWLNRWASGRITEKTDDDGQRNVR